VPLATPALTALPLYLAPHHLIRLMNRFPPNWQLSDSAGALSLDSLRAHTVFLFLSRRTMHVVPPLLSIVQKYPTSSARLQKPGTSPARQHESSTSSEPSCAEKPACSAPWLALKCSACSPSRQCNFYVVPTVHGSFSTVSAPNRHTNCCA